MLFEAEPGSPASQAALLELQTGLSFDARHRSELGEETSCLLCFKG